LQHGKRKKSRTWTTTTYFGQLQGRTVEAKSTFNKVKAWGLQCSASYSESPKNRVSWQACCPEVYFTNYSMAAARARSQSSWVKQNGKTQETEIKKSRRKGKK
jgi:hypothetical protein